MDVENSTVGDNIEMDIGSEVGNSRAPGKQTCCTVFMNLAFFLFFFKSERWGVGRWGVGGGCF